MCYRIGFLENRSRVLTIRTHMPMKGIHATMKKWICSLLIVSLLFTAVTVSVPAGATSFLRGDVNGDDEVDALDAFELVRYIAGVSDWIQYDLADVDGDGDVTAYDSFELRRHLADLIDLSQVYPVPDTNVGKITIAGNNIGKYTILVQDPENANIRFAATELQKYVKEACGRTLVIAEGACSDPYQIILCADDGSRSLGDDGYSITVSGGTLTIMGGAARGVMYGVYELLEEYFGYRFLGYNDQVLYTADTVDLPNGLRDEQVPTVRYRCITIDPFANSYTYSSVIKRKLSGCTGQPSMLCPEYGYGIERLFLNAHSMDYFVPDSSVPCLSSADTYETCLANMKALLDQRIAAGGIVGKSITEISCSYSAEGKFCACAECSATYQAEGSQAGVLVPFVNRIDNTLREEYPGIRVITNAYGDVRVPPKNVVLNDEVALLYCWNGCANHMIGSGECREGGNSLGYSNTKEEAYYLGWTEHCAQIYVWYYPTNIYYLLCPQPNLANLYNDFIWFMEHKATGFYVVGTTGSSFENLDAYLISNLIWDAGMTEEEYILHMEEYLRAYYGPGWSYIYTYIQMLTQAGDEMGCVLNDFEHPFDIYSVTYFADHFDEMQTLFAQASAACETEQERENIRRLSVHMLFLGYSATYESRYKKGTEEQRSAYTQGYRAWYDTVQELGIRTTYNTTGIEKAFSLAVSPMQLVYGIDGQR